jgi:hypothetical protein
MTTTAPIHGLAVQEKGALASVPDTGAGSMTTLLQMAVERGTPVAELKELVALHQLMEARQAAKDFANAMARFQEECPSIKRSSTAKIVTRGGATFQYTFAELDEIARTVNPILAKHGLSYTWDTVADEKMLTTICTVRHANGHAITSSFVLPVASDSAMSAQQKYAAAATFAQRKSLSAALGLTTTDDDPDGDANPEKITDDQVVVLTDLAKESGTNVARFCKWLGVEQLSDIPVTDYARAKATLERKKDGST